MDSNKWIIEKVQNLGKRSPQVSMFLHMVTPMPHVDLMWMKISDGLVCHISLYNCTSH